MLSKGSSKYKGMEVNEHEFIDNAKLELLICRLSAGESVVPGRIPGIMKNLMQHVKEFRF